MGEEYRDIQNMLSRVGSARLTRRSLLKYAAVGGALALFGGLIAGLSWVAGVGLIIGGAVSFFSGLFKKKDTL